MPTIAEYKAEVEDLTSQLNDTKECLDNANKELEDTLEELAVLAADNVELVERLQAADPTAFDDEPEEDMITLYWHGDVDLSMGLSPTAWGLNLLRDEDGNWVANMSGSRAEAELDRPGCLFSTDSTPPAPEVEEEPEEPEKDELIED